MRPWFAILFSGAWLLAGNAYAAATGFAEPEQDRAAKQAVPEQGKVLIYVYRLEDARPQAAPGLWLNGRESGPIMPRSYRMWRASPGEVEIHSGRVSSQSVDTMLLSLRTQADKSYYVRLVANADGTLTLREVPANLAKVSMQNARLLVGETATAAAPPAAPATPPAEPRKPARTTNKTDSLGLSVTAKIGVLQAISTRQTIGSTGQKLSAASFIYGLQGEWRHESDVAVSLEWFGHSSDYQSTTGTVNGDVDFSYFMLSAKKYFNLKQFNIETPVQPYVGAGLGRTTAGFSSNSVGGLNGDVSSNAWQLMGGAIIRWDRFDLYTEYKYLHDQFSYGGKANASGNGFFVGASINF